MSETSAKSYKTRLNAIQSNHARIANNTKIKLVTLRNYKEPIGILRKLTGGT